MFYLLFLGTFGWTLHQCSTRGPHAGLWRGWLISMLLMPAWMAASVTSVYLDLRTGAAVAALIGLLIYEEEPTTEPQAIARWLWSDVCIALLIFGQIGSQYVAGDLRPLTSFEILRKWAFPYLMGRFFLRSVHDIGRVLPLLCPLCVVLSVYAVVEALLKFNPVNKLFGKTYGLLELGEGYRMGLKRAQGPMDHPIFFGMVLVMIFPWMLEAARRGRRGLGPRWWCVLPLFLGAAIFATVSRGPQIAALATIFLTVFFRRPRWRLGLTVLALSAGLGLYAGKSALLEVLGQMAGETEETKSLIVINGEEYEYTGTNHRLLLYKVYDEAIRTAGVYGFGIKMKGIVIDDEKIAERFASIDNGYLLFYLQSGGLGVGMFLCLSLCNFCYLCRAAWDPGRPESGLAASLFGGLLGVGALMLSVWFAPDFGAVWLFCSGLAANLHSLRVQVAAPSPPARRRIPGHAPLRRQRHHEPNLERAASAHHFPGEGRSPVSAADHRHDGGPDSPAGPVDHRR